MDRTLDRPALVGLEDAGDREEKARGNSKLQTSNFRECSNFKYQGAKKGGFSERPTPIGSYYLLHREQEIEFGKTFEDAAFGPAGVEAEFIAIEEPGGGLLDGGLFEVGR